MTIVVEIASRTGTRAYKEYDAPSVDAAIEAASRSFEHTPNFRLQTLRLIGGERFSENQRKKP